METVKENQKETSNRIYLPVQVVTSRGRCAAHLAYVCCFQADGASFAMHGERELVREIRDFDLGG